MSPLALTRPMNNSALLALMLAGMTAAEHDPGALQVPEADRAAILAMAGEFRVTFAFDETVALVPDYERIEAHRPMDPERIPGSWTQCVYEVSDAPRYCGTGHWNHRYGNATWTSDRSWRPLPRREYTKRSDTVDFSPALTYWEATHEFWADVRSRWEQAASGGGLELAMEVDGMPLIVALFELAAEVQAGNEADDVTARLDEAFARWVRPLDLPRSPGASASP